MKQSENPASSKKDLAEGGSKDEENNHMDTSNSQLKKNSDLNEVKTSELTEEQKSVKKLSTPNCLTNAMVNRPCTMVCLGFLIMSVISTFVTFMDWMLPNAPNDRDFMVWGNPYTNEMDKTILVQR